MTLDSFLQLYVTLFKLSIITISNSFWIVSSLFEQYSSYYFLQVPKLSHYSKLKLLLDEFPNDMEVLHPLTGYILVLIRPLFSLENDEKKTVLTSLEIHQQLMIIDLRRLGSMCIGPIGIYKLESVSNLQSLLNMTYHNFLSVDSHTNDCMRSLCNNCINPTHVVVVNYQYLLFCDFFLMIRCFITKLFIGLKKIPS